jgi:hypothetical protein
MAGKDAKYARDIVIPVRGQEGGYHVAVNDVLKALQSSNAAIPGEQCESASVADCLFYSRFS